MKKLIAKALGLIFTINILISTTTVDVKAADYWPGGIDVVAESAIVMEQETGTILYSKNMDDKHFPASITKIICVFIVSSSTPNRPIKSKQRGNPT